MGFEVVISMVNEDGEIFARAIAEFQELPSPAEVELICQLTMSNAKFAIATVHVAEFPSVLYGVIVEGCDNGEKG